MWSCTQFSLCCGPRYVLIFYLRFIVANVQLNVSSRKVATSETVAERLTAKHYPSRNAKQMVATKTSPARSPCSRSIYKGNDTKHISVEDQGWSVSLPTLPYASYETRAQRSWSISLNHDSLAGFNLVPKHEPPRDMA